MKKCRLLFKCQKSTLNCGYDEKGEPLSDKTANENIVEFVVT